MRRRSSRCKPMLEASSAGRSTRRRISRMPGLNFPTGAWVSRVEETCRTTRDVLSGATHMPESSTKCLTTPMLRLALLR